ncbi:MAG: hypothetical protein LBV43_06740 [Prevotella sp.]|nr:hypothetical protein [Prevotella sp.]
MQKDTNKISGTIPQQDYILPYVFILEFNEIIEDKDYVVFEFSEYTGTLGALPTFISTQGSSPDLWREMLLELKKYKPEVAYFIYVDAEHMAQPLAEIYPDAKYISDRNQLPYSDPFKGVIENDILFYEEQFIEWGRRNHYVENCHIDEFRKLTDILMVVDEGCHKVTEKK